VHHFVELAPDAVAARRSLAAQVVWAYELGLQAAAAVPFEAASRPDHLERLLREAAGRLRPGEQLVVAVDGLDEAVPSGSGNVLGLPRHLPAGVFLVLSRRPLPVRLEIDGPREVARVDPEAAEGQGDLRRFLARAFREERIAAAGAEPPVTGPELVDLLVERSRGRWLYVRHVLDEIERTGRMEIRDLPRGLWRYYAWFWGRWREERGQGEWRQDLRLLSTLAAVREEVSLDLLLTLSGLEGQRELVERRLRQEWRLFLAVSGDSRRYRLSHASLREFLCGRGEGEPLPQERDLVRELAEAVDTAHDRIADRYLEGWGGLERGLPHLAADPEAGRLDGGYGLRCLPAHLEARGRWEDLHRLLATEPEAGPRRRAVNTWYAAHERIGDQGAYLTHLGAASRLAAARAGASAEERGQGLGRELRYLLMRASLVSSRADLPVELLEGLLTEGIWRPVQALAHVRAIPEPLGRVRAYVAVADHCEGAERHRLLAEALGVARTIEEVSNRAGALAALVPHLHPGERAEVLAEALGAARATRDEQDRAQALAALAPYLPPERRAEILNETLGVARATEGGRFRVEALVAVAPHLPPAKRPEVVEETLRAARTMENEWERTEVLAALAPHLPPGRRAELLEEALGVARTVEEDWVRAWALTTVARTQVALGQDPDRVVETLEGVGRVAVLEVLVAMADGLLALGGDPAVQECAHAVVDVGRWWP
jgi:hypothetical protein